LNHVKDNIEKLFSNADQLNENELETKFQLLLKEGDNTVKISGKHELLKLMNYFRIFFF
jgi:hypothetical protein